MSFLSRFFRPNIAKLAKARDYPALIAALRHDNQQTLNDAYHSLIELGADNVQPIIDALEHESDHVSRCAFEIIGHIGTPAVGPLLETLADTTGYRRRISPWLLGDICHESEDAALRQRVVDALVKALTYDNGTLRQNAASALGKMKDPRAIPALIKTLGDSHDMAARNAAWAIAELAADHADKCEPAIPGLIALLRHEDEEVQEQADFTISWIGPAAIDALLKEYDSGNANSLPIVQERLEKFGALDQVETPAEADAEKDETPTIQPWVAIVENAANLAILTKLCNAYATNDPAAISRLEPEATKLGEKLDEAGGMFAMRKMHEKVAHLPGCRTLEMHWGGIGDWRA